MGSIAEAFPSEVALVGGHLTAYHVAGDPAAPAVVLLHGLGATGDSYRAVVRQLSDRFRLIVPDLLGSGGTARPDTGYAPPQLAAHVAALLRQLGVVAPRAVVGHSQGAAVAVEVCRALGAVERLVVINPPPVSGMRWLRPFTVSARARSAELASALLPHRALAKLWLKFLYADGNRLREEVLTTYAANAEQRGYASMTAQSLHALARMQIRLQGMPPTLLLWGAEDPLFPPRLAQAWQKQLLVSTLSILPATGHCPHEERPDVVAFALRAFLDIGASTRLRNV